VHPERRLYENADIARVLPAIPRDQAEPRSGALRSFLRADPRAAMMPVSIVMESFAPRRELGRTGFRATALGIGDVADRHLPREQCVATLRRALDAGLNVVDTAPNYEDGFSEEIVGEAVEGRRDRLFVISKVDDLQAEVAPQVAGSLGRLRLERTDALVFHNVSRLEDWERLASSGGGLDQLADAIGRGETRFRGISSHHPDVLDAALADGRCDLLMFPVGPFVDARYTGEILPRARAAGVGTVCFKTFGAGKLLGDTSGYNQPLRERPRGKVSSGGDHAAAMLPRLGVEECLHYTLTLDPDVALLGLSFPNEQDAAFAAARAFRPLTSAEMARVQERAAVAIRDKGPVWWNPSLVEA
jgi:1-deoxyxylulose-5-phosphate synthase